MRAVKGLLAVAALLAAAFYIVACGDDPESNNLAPTVELTAGPMDGDSTAWNASFRWSGTDLDGYVDHYEYALDVPPERIDDIDKPAAPGINWVSTTAVEGTFPFTTPDADSAYGTDGMPGPPTRWTGMHTFVIRSVDDDDGRSPAEFLEFTALNYAPRTTIEGLGDLEIISWFPTSSCPPLIRWHADDPDVSDGPSDIVGHDYKIKQMPYTWSPVARSTEMLLQALADIPWVSLPAESTEVRPSLQSGYPYIVAVRTRDGRGATESVFVRGRNLFVADASAIVPAAPNLTVRDRVMGKVVFPGPIAEFTAGTGTILRFEMNFENWGNGSSLPEYNYGVDVEPDSDDEGPGWHGWSSNRVTEPIVFDQPDLHTVVFKSRVGSPLCPAVWTATGQVVVRSIPFPFDRDLLYVDDFPGGFPDAVQDQRNRAMLGADVLVVGDPARFTQFDAWGANDDQAEPTLITLESLAHFRTVYWDCLGSGRSRNPALLYANACPTGRVLQAYVAGGGGLWVGGQSVMAAFDMAPGVACRSNMAYEFGTGSDGLNFAAGEFPNDFLRLTGGGFQSARTFLDSNGLTGADPKLFGVPTGLPPLNIDHTVVAGPALGFTDGMLVPSFEESGGLDTLYTYRATRATSGMNHKPNAFRYHDPDPVPDQGPVAIFTFPLMAMEQGSVEAGTGTFKAAQVMLDWFRAEQQRFQDTHPR